MAAKTHEEVERAFSPLLDYTVPEGSRVRIILRPGLRITYVHKNLYRRIINEIRADELAGGRGARKIPYEMEGSYEECDHLHGLNEVSDDPILHFRKTRGYKKGYTLSVPCSYIADFEVLRQA